MNDKELLEVAKILVKASVISPNPYEKSIDYRKPVIYRMRLFSESERLVLRTGLRVPGSGWECIPGGAGLMDELEMVNFESNGKSPSEIRRTIGR